MGEPNGKPIACQFLITGLIARVANEQRDPLRFLTDVRDEIKAVVNGVNIAGMENSDRVRAVARHSVDGIVLANQVAERRLTAARNNARGQVLLRLTASICRAGLERFQNRILESI